MRFAVMAAMLAALLAGPAGAQTSGKKIQCWVDKNGQRMCGDRVPPEYAGQKRNVIDNGRIVDTIDASKTSDERAAEETRKKAEREQQKQAEYDRTLLELYRSQNDITTMRDERLELIDSRTQSAEKNAADTDKALAGLRARHEALQKDATPDVKAQERLAKQIKEFEKSQEHNIKALERYRKEREALEARFGRDYMRYSELRGLPATAPPPPKSATPPTPDTVADPKAGQAATPAEPAKPAAPKS
jgi:hypothetical protein